jgi:hypothetical protein
MFLQFSPDKFGPGLYEPPVNRYLTAQMTSATNSAAVRARRIV